MPQIIEYGGNINLATARGDTPITLWMSAERVPALRILLALGAKVNHRNRQGLCALHLASMVMPGGEALVKILLEGGAIPDLKDRQGYTPLHYAAGSCALESIRLLLHAGADINAQSKKGETPLAIVTGKKHLVEFAVPPSQEEYAATEVLLR